MSCSNGVFERGSVKSEIFEKNREESGDYLEKSSCVVEQSGVKWFIQGTPRGQRLVFRRILPFAR